MSYILHRYYVQSWSFYQLYGKPGNSVQNSKGMVHPGGNFERGWCIRIPNLTRLGIYLILPKLFINFFKCSPTDNTNIKKFLLFQYVSIAHDTGYRVVIVEPQTSWKLSISELTRRNHHNVTEERLRELLSEFDKVFALYYGWFLSGDSSKTLKDRMLKVLRDCCENIPSFQDSFVRDSSQEQDEPTSK